jgi:hypothetical protein
MVLIITSFDILSIFGFAASSVLSWDHALQYQASKYYIHDESEGSYKGD